MQLYSTIGRGDGSLLTVKSSKRKIAGARKDPTFKMKALAALTGNVVDPRIS